MSTTRILDNLTSSMSANNENDSKQNTLSENKSNTTETKKITLAAMGISVSYQIQNSELLINDKINQGSYGTVYKGEWRGMIVAVKELSLKYSSAGFLQEAGMMQLIQKLAIPNVPQYAGSTCCNTGYRLVMEYLPMQTVHDWLIGFVKKQEPTPAASAYKVAKTMATTLLALHNNNILHRDLKPENILYGSDDNIKLIDFGFSINLKSSENFYDTGCLGTSSFMAPEVITDYLYSPASDIFAFGSLLFALWEQSMLMAYPTWSNEQIKNTIAKGGRNKPTSKSPQAIAELINLCWQQDPKKRPATQTVCDKLDEFAKAHALR